VFGVVAVGVPRDDGDDPVVVLVDLLGRELLDLGDEPLVRVVDVAEHVAGRATARALDHGGVELVGVVDAQIALRLAALVERPQSTRGPVLPRGGVRDDILVHPSGGGLLLEPGQSDGHDQAAEADPVRLHETKQVVARSYRRADVGVVVGVVAGGVPLDHIERELRGVLGEHADGLEKPLVRDRPAREQVIGGLVFGFAGDASVEPVDVVVQLWIFAALEYARDPRRDCLLPGSKMREILVQRPAGPKLLREPLARERLECGTQRAIPLPDPLLEVELRNNRDRGTRHRPPSAPVPAHPRWRSRARLRGSAA